ncbi:MAG: hypothetical protein IJL66_07450 [Lachnospiraceae bacterium]|nr:hypothetical protein [Lachnospiraceae bacterium]
MKARRILALAGIAVLVLMYVLTLVFALIGSDLATRALQFSLVLTVIVPIVLYAFLLTLRGRGKNTQVEIPAEAPENEGVAPEYAENAAEAVPAEEGAQESGADEAADAGEDAL